MNVSRFLWLDRQKAALSSDMDDGRQYDCRLVEILNRHGLKVSFNLCSRKSCLGSQQSGWKTFFQ